MLLPHTIRTPRLLIRCWRESDAHALSQIITTHLAYFQPWMPWACSAEQNTPLAKLEYIRKVRREFPMGKTLGYVIRDPDDAHILGSVGLHARIGAGAREIGYWIHRDHAGKRLATEAAGALTRVGFSRLRLRRMEIHCDIRNEPSAGVAKNLGYALQTIIRNCVPRPTVSPRTDMIWALGRKAFDQSTLRELPVEAWSESGDKIL